MDPRELQGADLRTFTVRISRQQLRDLTLRAICDVWLDAPRLVFAERDQPWRTKVEGRIERNWGWYRGTADPKKRKAYGAYIRNQWSQLVSLAVGYTWPGNPPGYIEFAAP